MPDSGSVPSTEEITAARRAVLSLARPAAVSSGEALLEPRARRSRTGSTTPQLRPISGPEDDPAPAHGAMPSRFHLGERNFVDVDRQIAGGGDGHEFRDRGDDLSQGNCPRATAEDLQSGAPQDISRQGDPRAGHLSDFY